MMALIHNEFAIKLQIVSVRVFDQNMLQHRARHFQIGYPPSRFLLAITLNVYPHSCLPHYSLARWNSPPAIRTKATEERKKCRSRP